MTGGCSGMRAFAPRATGSWPRTWSRTRSRRRRARGRAARARQPPAAGLAAQHAGAQGHQRFPAPGGVPPQAARDPREVPATAADTEAEALNAIALARAREIIDGMPPRQREIALMRWRDRMRSAEIAAALGIAEGTVHARCTARGASWSRAWNGTTRSARIGGRDHVMTTPDQPDDDREDLFMADFYPKLGEYLARRHATATTRWPRALVSCSGSPPTLTRAR